MFKAIPTYRSEAGDTIQFFPVNNVPGFTHRVVINGQATRDFLGDHVKPSAKHAEFFFAKNQKKAA